MNRTQTSTACDERLMGRDVLLFDFDGTLVDSLPVIVRIARQVLSEHGMSEEEMGDIRRLAGPPFPEAFIDIYGKTQAEAESITQDYRTIYNTIGPEAWPAFEGMSQTLLDLKDRGYTLAIASSKGQPLVERGVHDNGWDGLFHILAGRAVGSEETKEDAIKKVIAQIKDKNRCVMIGDRHYDTEAARACSIPSVAVLWGKTCEREELEEAGASIIVETLDEFRTLFGL